MVWCIDGIWAEALMPLNMLDAIRTLSPIRFRQRGNGQQRTRGARYFPPTG
jgi:hypothetical protein